MTKKNFTQVFVLLLLLLLLFEKGQVSLLSNCIQISNNQNKTKPLQNFLVDLKLFPCLWFFL